MNLYIHTDLSTALKAQLRTSLPAACTIYFRNELSATESQQAFQIAEGILGNPPIDRWGGLPGTLKFWQLDSAGFNQYQYVHTSATVCNMGDWFARPCAETILGGVMALYRALDELTLLKQEARWVGAALRPKLRLLFRQKVVVLGAGTIGLAVAAILEGFGSEVHIAARTSSRATLKSKAEVLDMLPHTDLVVNCLPGTADRYVDADFIAAMKQGSVYANVGRGNTTDEAALISALEVGSLAGVVLDVTELEPLPESSPLWRLSNVVLTQHTGGGQEQEDEGKVRLFLENLGAYFAGDPLRFVVDLSRGY